jgi:hypothetical protein
MAAFYFNQFIGFSQVFLLLFAPSGRIVNQGITHIRSVFMYIKYVDSIRGEMCWTFHSAFAAQPCASQGR